MTQLKPYQQRVVDEKSQLDERIVRLKAFFEGAVFAEQVDTAEKDRLIRQLEVMTDYSDILAERIAAFMSTPATGPAAAP